MLKLDQAYMYMQHLMNNNWEYPDACFKACSRYNVSYEALADYYDEKHVFVGFTY